MAVLRCFVAVELSGEFALELGRLQLALKSTLGIPVAWSDPKGIHLTLKFLGDTPEEKIQEIGSRLQGTGQGFGSFAIRLGGLGGFPNLTRPRVLWMGVEGDMARLIELQRRVESEMAAMGFPAEDQTFRPHLTLGRVRSERAMGSGHPITGDLHVARLSQQVTSFALIRSQLTPQGAIYTRLTEVSLGVKGNANARFR
ncbi:MAG: 2'-5' ligase [Dehalococcoidia bacterium]|nr:2'-5' ligase [Dehalococcoidia bacterium]